MTGEAGTIVLGSGAVALAYALFQSRHGPVVLAGRPGIGAPGVERVPAPLLTILLELGVVPGELDIDRLTRTRVVAWEEPAPVERVGPACAHLDRAALVDALWQRVGQCRDIQVVPPIGRRPEVALEGAGWTGRRVVDATGRRALTASTRVRPLAVWVASCCTVPRGMADPLMQLAAGPTGYAYRLGSARWLTVAWVGPGTPPPGGAEVADRIVREGFAWLTEGLDLAGAPVVRRAASASIATGRERHVVALGDAVLGRDALASQGLAIGLSDARLAAGGAIVDALANRHAEGTDRHLHHLATILSTCAHQRTHPWLSYRRWVEHQQQSENTLTRQRTNPSASHAGSTVELPSELTPPSDSPQPAIARHRPGPGGGGEADATRTSA